MVLGFFKILNVSSYLALVGEFGVLVKIIVIILNFLVCQPHFSLLIQELFNIQVT